jgi:hypothetical protein
MANLGGAGEQPLAVQDSIARPVKISATEPSREPYAFDLDSEQA